MKRFLVSLFLISILTACYEDEELNEPIKENAVLKEELDLFIQENFVEEYNMAIRYRFVDRYINPGVRAVPPKLEVVRPMLDFIQEFWIDPYLQVENGEAFFRENVPPEIIMLGGLIYNADGTVTLGTADAGARITFTDVNSIDVTDSEWVNLQLQVVYHEFAHTVHQRFKLPNAFETITPTGYTGPGAWFTITNTQALERGYVSNYATLNPNEDFAETVAFYLFDQDFTEAVLLDEPDCETPACETRNEGRARIREKLAAINDHYKRVTGIDLDDLRAVIQAKLQ